MPLVKSQRWLVVWRLSVTISASEHLRFWLDNNRLTCAATGNDWYPIEAMPYFLPERHWKSSLALSGCGTSLGRTEFTRCSCPCYFCFLAFAHKWPYLEIELYVLTIENYVWKSGHQALTCVSALGTRQLMSRQIDRTSVNLK